MKTLLNAAKFQHLPSSRPEKFEENAGLDVPEDISLEKLLKAELLEEFRPFCNQVDGLKWMLGQEKRASVPLKGGILAGEC
jgi:hypothetical protein